MLLGGVSMAAASHVAQAKADCSAPENFMGASPGPDGVAVHASPRNAAISDALRRAARAQLHSLWRKSGSDEAYGLSWKGVPWVRYELGVTCETRVDPLGAYYALCARDDLQITDSSKLCDTTPEGALRCTTTWTQRIVEQPEEFADEGAP